MDHVDSFLYRPLYFMLNLFLFPSTIYTYEKLAHRKSCYVSCLGWIKQKLQVSQNRPIKTKECVFKKTCDPTIPLCLAQFELVVLSFFFFAVPMLEMQTQFLFSTPVKTRGDKRMGQVGQSTQNVRDSVHTKTGWWLTYPSEQWWSSSVGMMTFPIYGKTTFPNHQLENGW